MRYRMSPKWEEKRVRMDITILPSTKAKLVELQGDYSLSATLETCLLDYFELINEFQTLIKDEVTDDKKCYE